MNSTRNLALAALIPLATFALQWALWEYIDPYVWFLFYPAVFFAAVLTGLQGGIAATIISTLLVWYAFIPVRYSFALEAPHALISIVVFAVTGIHPYLADAAQFKRGAEAAGQMFPGGLGVGG
jgi:K+-sensing histidine kinase KdpD